MALGKGNLDRSREHLNFEIVGGKIQPIDKSKSIGQRLAENLAERGIKDPNANLAAPSAWGRPAVASAPSCARGRMTV